MKNINILHIIFFSPKIEPLSFDPDTFLVLQHLSHNDLLKHVSRSPDPRWVSVFASWFEGSGIPNNLQWTVTHILLETTVDYDFSFQCSRIHLHVLRRYKTCFWDVKIPTHDYRVALWRARLLWVKNFAFWRAADQELQTKHILPPTATKTTLADLGLEKNGSVEECQNEDYKKSGKLQIWKVWPGYQAIAAAYLSLGFKLISNISARRWTGVQCSESHFWTTEAMTNPEFSVPRKNVSHTKICGSRIGSNFSLGLQGYNHLPLFSNPLARNGEKANTMCFA